MLKLFHTDIKCDETDPRAVYRRTGSTGDWYITQITEVHDTHSQEKDTASNHGFPQSYDIPAQLGEASPTVAGGMSIDPLLLAPERGFLSPYVGSQPSAMDGVDWVYPSASQQTNVFAFYPN